MRADDLMKGMALSVLLLIDSRPRPSALKLIERCQREQLIGISQGLLSFWPEATKSLRNKYSRRTMPSARKEQNVLEFSRPLLFFPIPGQSPVSISQTPHIYFRSSVWQYHDLSCLESSDLQKQFYPTTMRKRIHPIQHTWIQETSWPLSLRSPP